jgi:lysyl-tRNA synthetase class 2
VIPQPNPLTIPYRYERSASIDGARDARGRDVSVAGRLVALRAHGGIVFGDLRDASGDIQLLFRVGETDGFELLDEVTLGSWVGVTGRVTTTHTGEATIAVARWQLLARCDTGWVDVHHGLTDPETRLRRRWVDLWADPDAMRRFRQRSQILSSVRRFFEAHGFIEVETPILQPIPGGANARPFVTHHNALGSDLYLRIAPELYLKRCVAAGVERVSPNSRCSSPTQPTPTSAT